MSICNLIVSLIMLALFRVYRRCASEDEQSDKIGLINAFEFNDAILHISNSTTEHCHVYDLEIIPLQLQTQNYRRNQHFTMSPMNIEFYVFVGKKQTQSKNMSLCWFSLIELWHLLHYDKNNHNDIRVDDRMAGHFLFFRTLLMRFSDNKIKQNRRESINWWKSKSDQIESDGVAYCPIDDTIFVSDIALWYFIFSSKYAKRALFVARILYRYVYPTIENSMATRVIHFASLAMQIDYYNEHHSKWSAFYLWLRSRIRTIPNWLSTRQRGAVNNDSIDKQQCNKRIDELHRCTRYSYPFLMSYCKYLKRQIGYLENQLIRTQRQITDDQHGVEPIAQRHQLKQGLFEIQSDLLETTV